MPFTFIKKHSCLLQAKDAQWMIISITSWTQWIIFITLRRCSIKSHQTFHLLSERYTLCESHSRIRVSVKYTEVRIKVRAGGRTSSSVVWQQECQTYPRSEHTSWSQYSNSRCTPASSAGECQSYTSVIKMFYGFKFYGSSYGPKHLIQIYFYSTLQHFALLYRKHIVEQTT